MKFSLQETSHLTKMILIGEFLLVSYLLYALALNVYQSYQIDYHIRNFEEENRKITELNKKAADDLLYYTSDQYLEKIAKQNLGVVNPGEEVIVLSDEIIKNVNEENIEQPESDTLQKYYNLSNPRKWWKFFFEIDHRKNSKIAAE